MLEANEPLACVGGRFVGVGLKLAQASGEAATTSGFAARGLGRRRFFASSYPSLSRLRRSLSWLCCFVVAASPLTCGHFKPLNPIKTASYAG